MLKSIVYSIFVLLQFLGLQAVAGLGFYILFENEDYTITAVHLTNFASVLLFFKIFKIEFSKMEFKASFVKLSLPLFVGLILMVSMRLIFEGEVRFLNLQSSEVDQFFWVSVFNSVILIPVVEELVFRKWIFSLFQSNKYVGALFSGILFLLIHFDSFNINVAHHTSIFLFSFIVCIFYLKLGISSSISFHVGYNLSWLLTL